MDKNNTSKNLMGSCGCSSKPKLERKGGRELTPDLPQDAERFLAITTASLTKRIEFTPPQWNNEEGSGIFRAPFS